MPRRARRSVGGLVYHVLNRANSRRKLFHSVADYLAFLVVLLQAHRRFPNVEIFAFCIMPNHWHLVVRPASDRELSHFMRWLTQTHTQRWRHAKNTVGYGSLYQGRFKAFVVEEDLHFLVLCRYVERNALRAKLVRRAEQWRWCSAWVRRHGDQALRDLLSDWPVRRPDDWSILLNERQTKGEEQAVQTSLRRNCPLGGQRWTATIVRRLDLEHTLRSRGRPKKR